MILSKEQHETIHQRLLMLFAFILPLNPRLGTLTIILLGLNWLSTGAVIKNFKSLIQPIPIIFISFYLLHLIGLIYSSNMAEGLQKVETKLPLLVFPLIFFTFPFKHGKNIPWILKAFVLGGFLATLWSCLQAVLKYLENGENWMYYKKLSSFLGYHPTYFSIYLSFALFICLFFLIKNGKSSDQKIKAGMTLLSFWFFLFILLLASRMTILATSFILGVAFLGWMFFHKKLWQGIGISLIAILLLGFSLKQLPGLKKRTNVTIQRIENQNQKKGVSDVRVNIWNAAMIAIKRYPIIGTGTGDTQDELVKIYIEEKYERGVKSKFNPHNQYLQTTVTLGVFGGLLLLIYLLLPFRMAFQQKDYLYLLFLALIILSLLTESIFQRQHGTLFFGFFHTLFTTKLLFKKEVFEK